MVKNTNDTITEEKQNTFTIKPKHQRKPTISKRKLSIVHDKYSPYNQIQLIITPSPCSGLKTTHVLW